jgi:hypothetical protein
MKRLLPLAVPFAAAAALAACATPIVSDQPYAGPMEPLRVEDFAWSTAKGSNVITGEVAYRTGAGPWTCAGGSVGLTPETAYSRQRVAALYGSTRRATLPVQLVRSRSVEQPAADYGRFVRTVRCDAQGRFTFGDLPDGSWFIIAQAKPGPGAAPEDALAIMQHVEVRGGLTRILALG